MPRGITKATCIYYRETVIVTFHPYRESMHGFRDEVQLGEATAEIVAVPRPIAEKVAVLPPSMVAPEVFRRTALFELCGTDQM
jgi:hypothetical protein